ncbi:MAG TPA: insulinase family protein, partial [Beutenbergiaceae bacterium]|nr:insulinase family protein [Beutenbergiaceae bacterium]
GGLVLGMEDTGSRMSWLGRAELALGEYVSLDEQIKRIQSVTAAQVSQLAQELYDQPRHAVVVGPQQ